MNRPWKIISHYVRADGSVGERIVSYGSLKAAANAFEVVVLFDMTARLEWREPRS